MKIDDLTMIFRMLRSSLASMYVYLHPVSCSAFRTLLQRCPNSLVHALLSVAVRTASAVTLTKYICIKNKNENFNFSHVVAQLASRMPEGAQMTHSDVSLLCDKLSHQEQRLSYDVWDCRRWQPSKRPSWLLVGNSDSIGSFADEALVKGHHVMCVCNL